MKWRSPVSWKRFNPTGMAATIDPFPHLARKTREIWGTLYCLVRNSLEEKGLGRTEQNAQIAQVVVGGPGHQRVSQGAEQRISIEAGQRRRGVEPQRLASFYRGCIRNRSRGGAVSVNAITARAEHQHRPGKLQRAGQGELL